jgi:hypothetical protein
MKSLKRYTVVFTCNKRAGFENKTIITWEQDYNDAREWAENLINRGFLKSDILRWSVLSINN